MQILFKSKIFEVKIEDFFFVFIKMFVYRETEQMKLLYETINQASLLNNSNRLYQCGTREFSRLEPRRSNPLDRYQLPE
jgi:hypothetical protein